MTIRAAVLGTGFGTRVHVPGLRLAGAEVVAIASRQLSRAQAAARDLGIAGAFDDAGRMLDAARPELLCIATPPAAHVEAVRAAADRGVHVICEKPLAYDAAQAWEAVAAAERAGIVHATDFQFRYWPARARFHRLVGDGALGELRLLRYVWTAPMRLDPAAPGFNWFAQAEEGGGVLQNLGTHFVDFVRWCFGEVASATGALRAFVAERRLPDGTMARVTSDDTASTELALQSGALVTAQYGFVTAGRRILIEAYGSEGTLVLDDDRLLLAGRGPDGPLEPVGVPTPEPPEPKPLAPFVLLAKDVLARVRGERGVGEGVLPTFVDGARTQEIIDAIRLGAREGRWRDVERKTGE